MKEWNILQQDHLLKLLDKNGNFRVFLASTTALVDEAQRRHRCSATAAAALGRVLTATVMLGCDLKNESDALTLRICGNGPAETVLATADNRGKVRGLISNPWADAPSLKPGKLNVAAIIGNEGYVEVIKDIALKQPFTGKSELVSGEIAEDLANYLLKSEQIPALVSLGVLVDTDLSIKSAGGLIVQALPEADLNSIEVLEKNIAALGPISSAINENTDLFAIAELIMKDIEYDVVGDIPLMFQCKCSHDRLLHILSSLSEEEWADMTKEQEPIEVICNYCAEPYYYSLEEIKKDKEKALGR